MARFPPVVIVAALLACTACGTDPPMMSSPAVALGQASITITRSGAAYPLLATADIDVNGARVASLGIGQSYSGPVSPGTIILTATCWCGPGRYSAKFNAEPGKNYSFLVSPRGEQLAAQATGGLVGLAIDTSDNGENSGTFNITAIAQ